MEEGWLYVLCTGMREHGRGMVIWALNWDENEFNRVGYMVSVQG